MRIFRATDASAILGVILGVAAGCDNKDEKPAAPPSAAPAKSSAAPSAKPSAAPSAAPSAKPEGKGGKTKGGGKQDAKGATDEKQKVGAKIKDKKDEAKKQAAGVDSIDCTADIDGAAFCDDDKTLYFCLEKTWYALECNKAFEGSFCGYDEASDTVDCWSDDVFSPSDDEDDGDVEGDDDGEMKEG